MITSQRIVKALGKHITRTALRARHAVGAPRPFECPACHQTVAGFFRYGQEQRWGCPLCGSSPRERVMHALLDKGLIKIPAAASILHLAPNEQSLVERFSVRAADYVPADIDPSRYSVPGMTRVDLMALNDDHRFDIIYASHVMEHVPDDSVVLRNIARALKPGGEAWLIVPLWSQPSEDGAPDLSGKERERRFGQWDHVRQYGRDFADRIRAAGLTVDVIDSETAFAVEDRHRMALADVLFRARRA